MRDLEENRACEQNRATTLGWIFPFPGVGVIRHISRRFCNMKAFSELLSVISRRIGWGGKRMYFSFTSCYKESTSLAGKSSAKDATHGQEPRNLGIDRKDKVKVCACYPEAWEYQRRGSMDNPEIEARLYNLAPISPKLPWRLKSSW